eukprot:15472877-Alexandrium_andersonii.AAC.1
MLLWTPRLTECAEQHAPQNGTRAVPHAFWRGTFGHPGGPKLPLGEVCGTAHFPLCGVCCPKRLVKRSV